MGLMTIRLKDPKDAQKSGRVMLMILTIIYSFFRVGNYDGSIKPV